MNDFYNSLLEQGYSKEQIESILQLGLFPEQMDQINRKRETAMKLRDSPMPQGRHTGRTYVASNPLSHIAKLGKQYLAQRQLEGLDKEATGVSDEQVKRRLAFLRGGSGAMGYGTPLQEDPGMPAQPPPRFQGKGTSGI